VASGRSTALKLKEVLSRQQFEIILQAKVGQKVITLATAKLFMMWIGLHAYYHPS
jgi:translation elongation factor EF-4